MALYFPRDSIGFENVIDLFVGPVPNSTCLLAIELCSSYQCTLQVHYSYYDETEVCPIILFNEKLVGGYAEISAVFRR